MDQETEEPTGGELPGIVERVVSHWKVWVVGIVLGVTAYVLYGIGGMTPDTMTFGLAAVLAFAYGLWSVRLDID